MFEMEKIFVKPGAGVKVPLPVGGRKVPAEGLEMQRDFHVERLLRTGDLVEVKALPPAKSEEKKG